MFRLAALMLLISHHAAAFVGGIRTHAVLDQEENRKLVVDDTACFGESFAVTSCTLGAILEAMAAASADPASCGKEQLAGYLGDDDVEKGVEDMCRAAMDRNTDGYVPFEYILMEGKWMDREYYDGHTKYNEQVQTRINTAGFGGGFDTQSLRFDAARIDRIFRNDQLGAENHGIEWPTYIPNFVDKGGTCEHNAAMCCWVQDRQANDNNGNCRDDDANDANDNDIVDYDTFCKDKDPADNTEICYVDMTRSPLSNHVAGGYAVFDGENVEGDTHCHGMAWPKDEYDNRSRYLGNNMFYISMYDHLETRGYTRNVPGAPMCGCMSQMPVVERSDCTQMDITETFEISLVGSVLEAEIVDIEIDFNSCQGKDANGNNDNNDLESYARVLFGAESEELKELQEYLVGDNNCQEAIDEFLDTQLTSVKTLQLEYVEGENICILFNKANPNRNDELLIVYADDTEQIVETIYTTGTNRRVDDSRGVVSDTICYGDGSNWRSESQGPRILPPNKYRVAFRENVGGGQRVIRAMSDVFTVVPDHYKISTEHGVYYEGQPIPIKFEDGGHRMDNYIACYTSEDAESIEIGAYSSRDQPVTWIYSACQSTSWRCWEDLDDVVVTEGTIAIPSKGWSNNKQDPYYDLNRFLEPGLYKCFYREVGSSDSFVWAATDRFVVLPASKWDQASIMSLTVTDPLGNEFALENGSEFEYSLAKYGITGNSVDLTVEAIMYPTVVRQVVFTGTLWGSGTKTENVYPYSINGETRDETGHTLKPRTFTVGKQYVIDAVGYDSEFGIIDEAGIVLTIVAE